MVGLSATRGAASDGMAGQSTASGAGGNATGELHHEQGHDPERRHARLARHRLKAMRYHAVSRGAKGVRRPPGFFRGLYLRKLTLRQT